MCEKHDAQSPAAQAIPSVGRSSAAEQSRRSPQAAFAAVAVGTNCEEQFGVAAAGPSWNRRFKPVRNCRLQPIVPVDGDGPRGPIIHVRDPEGRPSSSRVAPGAVFRKEGPRRRWSGAARRTRHPEAVAGAVAPDDANGVRGRGSNTCDSTQLSSPWSRGGRPSSPSTASARARMFSVA